MSLQTLSMIASSLVELRGRDEGIVLYPHIGADGDALGSCFGFAIALSRLDIQVRILLEEPPMSSLAFLPGTELASVRTETSGQEIIDFQSIAMAIDCEGPQRLGGRASSYLSSPLRFVLDHHPPSPARDVAEDGTLFHVDPSASSTGELVWQLISILEKTTGEPVIDAKSARCLMTALLADTGGFRFSNSNAASFRCAAALMEQEIDLHDLTRRLFDSMGIGRLRLTGRAFSEAEFHCDGMIASFSVPGTMLQECGATEIDLDGIAGRLRDVEGVVVAFVLREREDGTVRVNIRSGDGFDSSLFARSFGGGGHRRASGFTLEASLPQATKIVIAAADQVLR